MTIVSSEGSTVVNERRLASNVIQPKSSGPTELATAIANIQQNPIRSQIPAIGFNVDVPQTISEIYGVPKTQEWAFVNMGLAVKTPLTDIALIRTNVATLLQQLRPRLGHSQQRTPNGRWRSPNGC